MDFKKLAQALGALGKVESLLRTRYEKLYPDVICLLITVRGGHVFNDIFKQEGNKVVAQSKYYPITFPVVCRSSPTAIREEIDKTLSEGRIKTHSYVDIVKITECTLEEAEEVVWGNIQDKYFTLKGSSTPAEKQAFLDEKNGQFIEYSYKKIIKKKQGIVEEAPNPKKECSGERLRKVKEFKRNGVISTIKPRDIILDSDGDCEGEPRPTTLLC